MPGSSARGSAAPPLLVLGLGIGVLIVSAGIRPGMLDQDPGPAFLPRIAGGGLVLLSLYLLRNRTPHEGPPGGRALFRVAATVALIFAYLNALQPLGFPLSTALFLGLEMWVIGLRNPLYLLGGPILMSAGVYLVFRHALDVALPATRLFGILI